MTNRRIPKYILVLDIAWLALALCLSYTLRFHELQPHIVPFYRLLLGAGIATWILLFQALRLDCFDRGWRLHAALGKVAMGTSLLMVLVITVAYLERYYYSRLLLSYFAGMLFLGFFSIRACVYLFLCSAYAHGHVRRVALLGSERFAREFAATISRHPELLYEVVGTLYPLGRNIAGNRGASRNGANLLSSDEVRTALAVHKVDDLIVLLDESPGVELQAFVAACLKQGIQVSVLPGGYELYTSKPRLVQIEGFPLISLERPKVLPGAAAAKRFLDLSISVLLLAPAACMVAAAAMVLLAKKRQVLRRELRVGKNGVPFWMYRLNVQPREAARSADLEHVLHRLSISELPQLLNVLRGEMSLVGPRPESPDRVKRYSDWERERLKGMPGITGLAQVNGLRDKHASEDKSRFDLQYLLEWTLFGDIVLLLRTLATLGRRCFPPSKKQAQGVSALQQVETL